MKKPKNGNLKNLVLFLLILCSHSILSQNSKTQLSGKVIDSLSKEPVYYATVSLVSTIDAGKMNGVISDEKGAFSLNDLVPGKYDITIDFMGFEPKTFLSYTVKAGENNLGTVSLKSKETLLSEVVIQADRPIIENKIDRLVYNAERDVTSAGGNAIDVLRKVPMLSVDIEGNVSLAGNEGVKILMNGKPSGMMANNMRDALKMIPADQIKSVEVITSPSAKYDAEGASGIINIITKRKDIAGINGAVSGGIGTRHNNGNASLNVRKGKLGIVANLGGNYMWPQIVTNEFKQFNAAGDQTIKQNGEQRTTQSGLRGSIGIDYDLTEKDLFSTTFSTNMFETSKNGTTISEFFQPNNVINSLKSNLDQENKINGFDWSADYIRKFGNPKQELAFSAQFSRNNNDTDYVTLYEEGLRVDEKGDNRGKNDELTFQVDYVQPIGKTTLEIGAKTILRDISSGVKISELVGESYQMMDNRSYDFLYNQDVAAAYMTYGFDFAKNYQAKVGLRMEHTNLEGKPTRDINPFSNDYTNLLPSAVISRKLSRTSSLKISYNQRIQRPSLFYLNPFRDTSDPIVQQQGNPELKPELSHNIELGYSTFIKRTMINASLFYRRTTDVIESLNQIENEPITGQPVSLKTFENIGNNESFGANLFVSISPIQNLTLRSNISLSTYEAKENEFNNALSSQTDEMYLVYRAFINATYKIDNTLVAESFFMLNSPKRTFQGTTPSFSMWTLGIKKEIMDKKATIGLSVTDLFSENKNFKWEVNTPEYSQTRRMKLPFRSFGITFSYNFGKTDSKNKPRKDRGIKNDDQKEAESNQGAQMGGGRI